MAGIAQPEPDETLECPLKTLPRLTGNSTRVVITEYDLPASRSSRMT